MEERIFCYLLESEGLYKIGKSKNPQNRVKQIRTGNPNVKLVDFSDKVTEKELHALYKNHRIKGEWFRLDEKQVNSILKLYSNGKQYNFDARLKQVRHHEKTIKYYNEYVFTFGKYKGIALRDLEDRGYLRWLKAQKYKSLSRYERKRDLLYRAITYALKKNI